MKSNDIMQKTSSKRQSVKWQRSNLLWWCSPFAPFANTLQPNEIRFCVCVRDYFRNWTFELMRSEIRHHSVISQNDCIVCFGILMKVDVTNGRECDRRLRQAPTQPIFFFFFASARFPWNVIVGRHITTTHRKTNRTRSILVKKIGARKGMESQITCNLIECLIEEITDR